MFMRLHTCLCIFFKEKWGFYVCYWIFLFLPCEHLCVSIFSVCVSLIVPLFAYVCVCVSVYVCVYLFACMCVYVCVYVSEHSYVCMFLFECVIASMYVFFISIFFRFLFFWNIDQLWRAANKKYLLSKYSLFVVLQVSFDFMTRELLWHGFSVS